MQGEIKDANPVVGKQENNLSIPLLANNKMFSDVLKMYLFENQWCVWMLLFAKLNLIFVKGIM